MRVSSVLQYGRYQVSPDVTKIGREPRYACNPMLMLICHFEKVMHCVWTYFHARLAFTMAAFNVLVQWHGFQPTASGFVPLSMAEFSL